MLDLVGNPEDQISSDAAHIKVWRTGFTLQGYDELIIIWFEVRSHIKHRHDFIRPHF